MIGALKQTGAFASDVNVFYRSDVLYPYTAVSRSEEIISTTIGKLYFSVANNDGSVLG